MNWILFLSFFFSEKQRCFRAKKKARLCYSKTIIVKMETSKEEPVAKRLRSRIVNMETSVAKRPRLEPLSDKEIIKNLKERIQYLEEQLKTQSILVPDLPNEIWLKIMSYLSTFDLLRNVLSSSFQKI